MSPRRVMRGGIDVGGTKIQAVVVDADSNVLGQARHPTPTSGGPADVVAVMATALREAAQAAEVEPAELAGVGVGFPGTIEEASGSVSGAANLPGWQGSFGVQAALAEDLATRVAVGNDVQVATNAEFQLGAGRPYASLVGVFWGTGVGGGLVLDGEPWTGQGAAGEIGHIVIKLGGARCSCGRRGCMEAYAGRASMEARAREFAARGRHTVLFEIMEERGRERLTSGVWARALEQDDKLAREILARAVKALGAGVASVVNVLDVEAVILGGGLGVRFGEPYAERIAAAMKPHLFVETRTPKVHTAALGDLGGAIGAALLAAD